MSDKSYASFLGMAKLRARLEQLTTGLKDAASGAVLERAAEKIRVQVDTVARNYAEEHKLTGAALAGMTTVVNGSLVQNTANEYLRFHDWWPFRGGRLPPFVLAQAVKIYAAELEAAIKGEPSPLVAAEEAAAEKSRARFKRETSRIFRQSAEGKAKMAAERKAYRESPEGKAKAAERKAYRESPEGKAKAAERKAAREAKKGARV